MSAALASASADVDVAVVGAGVAGLAAAGALRRAGWRVLLLEAGRRIGGRAWTEMAAGLGGALFDHGAQWLHAAHRNPLVALAAAHGETVQPDMPWEGRVRFLLRDGTAAPPAAFLDAALRWRAAVDSHDGPDCSLADAARAVAGDPWTPTIEALEAAVIAAADADRLSLHDWRANLLTGENFVVPGGLGALVARLLGPPAGPVRLGARVARIAAGSGMVTLTTADGATARAGAALVTVSTGVLRSGRLGFTPALPAQTQAALDGLPMGLLTKIALRAAGADRLGVPPGADVIRQVPASGAACIAGLFWPQDRPLALGFVGGRAAWNFSARPAEAVDAFRQELAAMFGSAALAAFAAGGIMTGWGNDPDFLGAYAYAVPGAAQARGALAQPLWDRRLIFAGEACAPCGLAGTVAGAYLSGLAAARSLISGFTEPRGAV